MGEPRCDIDNWKHLQPDMFPLDRAQVDIFILRKALAGLIDVIGRTNPEAFDEVEGTEEAMFAATKAFIETDSTHRPPRTRGTE